MNESPSERFQLLLFDLVKLHKPSTVVETGVGESSRLILKAMDSNKGPGTLHTIESFCHQPFSHPRWKYHKGLSTDILLEVLLVASPCDFFVHDSDHGFGCQTFEYEMALQYVKPGGFIITDDFEWGNPPHRAWASFVKRHNLGPCETLGTARLVRIPILP